MSFELREVREWATGTLVFPKYEVYDQRGMSNFMITVCQFTVYDRLGMITESGACTVNNEDTDLAGNTIKTVQAAISLSQTWATAGHYSLVFYVTLQSGETEKLMAPIKIRSMP